MTNPQDMTTTAPSTLIPRRWRFVVQVIWFAFAFWFIAIAIAGIPAYFSELRDVCVGGRCQVLTLSSLEADLLRGFGLSPQFYSGYHTGLEMIRVGMFALLAVFIFWQKSGDWMGVLFSVSLLAALVGLGQVDDVFVSRHSSLHQPHETLVFFAAAAAVFFFLLFPNGRFVPGWTRYAAIIYAGAVLIDQMLATSGARVSFSEGSMTVLLLGSLAVAVIAQIYRYRRVSNPSQRQQTKWLVFGITMLVVAMFSWNLLAEFFPFQPSLARLIFYTIGYGLLVVLIVAFPVFGAFSILRYRLWDIDIVINRTLVYGFLTATLALTYFGSVVVLQALFRALTGQGSPVAIAISTFVIASLFVPLRRRVQRVIDRRFFRRKYDAEQILGRFTGSVRNEYELDSLTAEMSGLVKSAMQAKHVSVWLKHTPGTERATTLSQESLMPPPKSLQQPPG